MTERPIPEAFVLMCELALALGVEEHVRSPQGWIHQLTNEFYFALNGTCEAREITVSPRGGIESEMPVAAFSAVTFYNGWPQGIYDPGGAHVAGSAFVPENSPDGLDRQLCVALRAAIDAARARPEVAR